MGDFDVQIWDEYDEDKKGGESWDYPLPELWNFDLEKLNERGEEEEGGNFEEFHYKKCAGARKVFLSL